MLKLIFLHSFINFNYSFQKCYWSGALLLLSRSRNVALAILVIIIKTPIVLFNDMLRYFIKDPIEALIINELRISLQLIAIIPPQKFLSPLFFFVAIIYRLCQGNICKNYFFSLNIPLKELNWLVVVFKMLGTCLLLKEFRLNYKTVENCRLKNDTDFPYC